MMRAAKFRYLLPLMQIVLAALFGGWGLWERSAILSRVFVADGQTLWDTTARFHVWPWPLKFAVVMNTPAFLFWGLVSWPVGHRFPRAPETVMMAPSLFFVGLLWYVVGRWIDKTLASPVAWALLLGLVLVCVAGASVPSTTFYLLWGVAVWLLAGCGMLLSGARHGREFRRTSGTGEGSGERTRR